MASVDDSNGRFISLALLLGAIILLGWILIGPGNAFKYYETKAKLEEIQAENERLKGENSSLQNEIEKLTSDPGYIEEVARDKHGFLKKNEMVFELTPKK
jgi:cell division protein FtsB